MTDKNIPVMKIERLTLIVCFIVIANFMLGIILAWPVISPSKQPMPSQVATVLIMIFMLVYYMLFLMFTTHYRDVFKEYIKGKEIKFVIVGSLVGLVLLAVFSFWKLGISSTFQWLIPTVATIILTIILNYLNKKQIEKSKEQKTPSPSNK